MLVAGDNELGFAGQSAGKELVVVRVGAYRFGQRRRQDQLCLDGSQINDWT